MANLLNRNNKHLFLEKPDKSPNSFIANVNIVRKYLQEIIEVASNLDIIQLAINAANIATKQAEIVKNIYDQIIIYGKQIVASITAEGEKQKRRLEGMVELEGLINGVSCGNAVWTVTEPIAVGTEIILPEELRYVVGRHHLQLSYDGVVMSRTWFTEVGGVDTISNSFITNMPFRIGQEICAWVVPLGRTDVIDIVDSFNNRITNLEDAYVDLSRKVVYIDEDKNNE